MYLDIINLILFIILIIIIINKINSIEKFICGGKCHINEECSNDLKCINNMCCNI